MIMTNDEILNITKRFPEDFSEGIQSSSEMLALSPETIYYSGMGGSGICGEVMKDIFSYDNIPVYTHHNYGYFKGKFRGNDVHIFSSYSGNTEETLNAFIEAGDLKNRFVISSGGKLLNMAQENGIGVLKQKEGYQPRLIFPFTLGLILKFFDYFKKHDIDEKQLVNDLKSLRNGKETVLKIKSLAEKFKDKFIVIYSSFNTHGVALRLSAQFNENAKLLSHTAFYPECNHNEILALKQLSKMQASCIFIKSKFDNERVKLRMKILEEMMGKEGIDINVIEMSSDSVLGEIMSFVYFGDLLSVYTAVERGVMAGDIEEIENLKKELSKK